MKQGQCFTIVMIDDDNDEADLMEEAFAESHYSIQFKYFSSFDEFIASVNRSVLPDLIVMDINLPCKNGIQCIHELKADPALSHIPVVTFSNSHCAMYEDETRLAGALQLFVKPTTMSEYRKLAYQFCMICLQHSSSQFEEQAVA